ncbi:uncharacterized protein LOC114301983 isoform X2 [Camellia sinensis]|uniref:uncharacterized protein LOC114301983 isoform X2 n=1 Tax=Camellia sinensis TaxID=4442 RepID=UPI0010363577|nr:uncharacterized protein LOC114301983 isoform X2 [Camellia sinensis]
MLNDWCQTPIHMEDFGNAMTEQHEKGVTHFEEGVSHTAAGALHSKDGLTQSPQRVPAFTEIITHSEERGSHADEQHLRTTHALHEEVPVSAITQSEEEGAQSGDWIPLNTERVTHCEEGGHMLMSEYYLLRLWTLFLIGGNEIDIKLLRRVSYRFQKPHVARELAKLDILDVAPIHLPLLGTNSSDVCIEEIKEANGLIGDTIYAGNKYEVISPSHVEDFCYIIDNTYIKENVSLSPRICLRLFFSFFFLLPQIKSINACTCFGG